jgi:hypothetical protein
VAEGARLESVYAGNRIVGSNPTPSAIIFCELRLTVISARESVRDKFRRFVGRPLGSFLKSDEQRADLGSLVQKVRLRLTRRTSASTAPRSLGNICPTARKVAPMPAGQKSLLRENPYFSAACVVVLVLHRRSRAVRPDRQGEQHEEECHVHDRRIQQQ